MKSTPTVLLVAACGLCFAHGFSNHGLFMFGLDELERKEAKDDPKPCCLPETWQGFVQAAWGSSEGRGRSKGGFSTTELFIDGAKKRMAGKVMVGCPKMDFTFVGLYNQSSGEGLHVYAYKTANATKCWSHYWDKLRYEKPCLPANSTFLGSMKIGLASSGWTVNSFRFSQRMGRISLMADLLVTPDACVPVAYRELGRIDGRPHNNNNNNDERINDIDDSLEDDDDNDDSINLKPERLLFTPSGYHLKPRPRRGGKKFVVSALYNDLEPKIKDEKVFDLPEICKKSPESYPLDLDDVTDPETREGLENLEAILEYLVV